MYKANVAIEGMSLSQQQERVGRAFSAPAWFYDIRGFFILTFTYRSTLPVQVRFFSRLMSASHLEIAIGTGTLLKMILAWRGIRRMGRSRITGIEYSENMLEGAQRTFARRTDMEVMRGDATRLQFRDGSFDSINCANALHCIPDVDAAIQEAFRVLKPGGTFAANVLLFPSGPAILRRIAQRINDWAMRKGILHTPYELDDLRRRFEAAGFRVEEDAISGNSVLIVGRKPAA